MTLTIEQSETLRDVLRDLAGNGAVVLTLQGNDDLIVAFDLDTVTIRYDGSCERD